MDSMSMGDSHRRKKTVRPVGLAADGRPAALELDDSVHEDSVQVMVRQGGGNMFSVVDALNMSSRCARTRRQRP